MSDPDDQFALVPLPPPGPERDTLTARAMMVGDMSAVTEPILSSRAREETEALLEAAADAIAEEHRLARQREREEARAYADAVQKLCEGAAKMAHRLDALEKKRRADAREARRQERKGIEDGLPDPDEPDAPPRFPVGGEGPGADTADAPNVVPGFSFAHEPGETSFEYVEDGVTGNLPEEIESRSPPELGDFPTYKKSELKHPQEPIPQTPTAVGGP
jgi:hypothetical protein